MKNPELENMEVLFKANYKGMCNVVYRIIRDWDAAEDVVQEMFIRLWKKRDEIKIESTLKGYLYKSASNAAINYLEWKKSQKTKEEITEHNTAFYMAEEPVRIDQQELEARIKEALERLPPKCRTIFLLSRLEGMKYQEIADHLDLSLKTVENQMGIALKKLKEDLTPYLTREFFLWLLLLPASLYFFNFFAECFWG